MLQATSFAAANVMLACHEMGCRVVLAGSMEEPDPGDPEAVPQSPHAAATFGRLRSAAYHAILLIHHVLRFAILRFVGQTRSSSAPASAQALRVLLGSEQPPYRRPDASAAPATETGPAWKGRWAGSYDLRARTPGSIAPTRLATSGG